MSDTALGFTPSPSATLTLNLVAEQQTAKDYRQYTYRKSGSFIVVNGVEDGVGKKVLRYNITGLTPDQVEVYVDGVKRTNGLGPNDYQLYDGTVSSPVPPNSVQFNSVVVGVAPQVDVIVTKAATLSTASYTLSRAVDDEARVGTGAWEGVDFVSSPALTGNYSLFYLDFSELALGAIDLKLTLDTTTPSTVNDVGTSVVTDAFILLSRTELYTQLDRQRAKYVPLGALVNNTNYLIVKLIDGVRRLYVTEGSAIDVFPMLEVGRFDAPTLQSSSLLGNSDAAQLDNTIIVGPDA